MLEIKRRRFYDGICYILGGWTCVLYVCVRCLRCSSKKNPGDMWASGTFPETENWPIYFTQHFFCQVGLLWVCWINACVFFFFLPKLTGSRTLLPCLFHPIYILRRAVLRLARLNPSEKIHRSVYWHDSN